MAINENSNLDTEINNLKSNIIKLSDIKEDFSQSNIKKRKIFQLLNNNSLKIVSENIYNNTYSKKISYDDLNFLYDTLKLFFEEIETIKDKIDIEIFLKKGNRLDITKLRNKFKRYGKDKEFPNFDFSRLKELIENPPTELEPMDNHTKEKILYDPIIVRKYIYAIIQMVIDEMDLVVIFSGSEGMGKSLATSQDMNLVYYLLKELKLINYEYKISDMWFNTVEGFNQKEDEYFNEKFRILGLDEGNELNSQDWQNPNVKTFFQRLRRERFNQRIKFISIPQLVELLKGVSISRANFFFYMESTDDLLTGTLNKGFCNFYVMPKNKIYSYYKKKELYRNEVQTSITNHLKDKNSGYKKLPDEIIIKRYRRNHIWGFDKKNYVENLKESNKIYSVEKGIRLNDYQSYLFYKFIPDLKNWGFDGETRKLYKESYATIQKTISMIKKNFLENPEKKIKYDNILQEQLEKNKQTLESN